MSVTILRRDVLSLYRKILRFARNWTPKDPSALIAEQSYIKNEARSQFQKNLNLRDEKVIKDCIREAETRMEIASHYQNPYPRPVNVLPKALARKFGKEGEESSSQQEERFKKLS